MRYNNETKGFKSYHRITKKLIISRNVIFNEEAYNNEAVKSLIVVEVNKAYDILPIVITSPKFSLFNYSN